MTGGQDSDPSFVYRFIPAAGGNAAGAPTLLLLHGTGGSETDLLDLGRTLASGANLLSPRGQVTENGMPRFFRRHAEGVFDIDDLKSRTDLLAAFITDACSRYSLDRQKVMAVGYSNGANIAASLLLRQPGVLAGAVLFRPMLPYPPDEVPDLKGRRVLILSGDRDPMVPKEQVLALENVLREGGAEVTRRSDPVGGHGLTPEEIPFAQEWLGLSA